MGNMNERFRILLLAHSSKVRYLFASELQDEKKNLMIYSFEPGDQVFHMPNFLLILPILFHPYLLL
jgi:hypothetical protein